MSRFVGFAFVLGDAITTIATFLNSSGALLVVILSALTSIFLASLSSTIRSLFWPTYFWDQPEPVQVVTPTRRHQSHR